jgi:nucleoside-diphosphate-sugar epimerase
LNDVAKDAEARKTVLLAGATGATGRLLLHRLLETGQRVRAVVRSAERIPADLRSHPDLAVTCAGILQLSDAEMADLVNGCHAVASCLGHNVTFKGLFGPPRRLVTDATRRLCGAIQASRPGRPTRFVLMNTNANRNHDLHERVAPADRGVVAILRTLLPPVRDNELAAEHLRACIGQDDPFVEWVAVRPDSLIDAPTATEVEVVPSPIRGIVFNTGRTSRINVAHFMARLITDDATWHTWKGRMPVIYNKNSLQAK